MSKKEIRKDNFIKDCKWLFKKPIYHRGKFDNKSVYENTMEAYKRAVDDKSPFEFDVQLTSDYEVICFHDSDLKRMFNRERLVKDISYKRINKLRDDLKVPLLKDVLKMVDGKVELMIELKNINHKFNNILVNKVHELLKDYKGKYVIVSFNPFILNLYKSLNNDVYRGRIGSGDTNGFFNKLIVEKNWFNFIAKPDFISYDVDFHNEERLKKYREKGYKITGWTLKGKDKIKNLKKYYDNFIIEGLEAKEL